MSRPLACLALAAAVLGGCCFWADFVSAEESRVADGAVVKAALDVASGGQNLLQADAWRPWQAGFERQDDVFLCDNGDDRTAQRGVSQTVVLNQERPEPIVAVAWSRAENVTGTPDSNYALYLDLTYQDGTPLWGQVASFATGTHDWQRRQVVVFPERPVRSLSFHMLLRGHGGKAWFRDPALQTVRAPQGACLFDGVPVRLRKSPTAGFQVRDVTAGSDFVRINQQALGLELRAEQKEQDGDLFVQARLRDTMGRDRAVTLVYAVPVAAAAATWLHDPRHSEQVAAGRELMNANRFRVGGGRLSQYPFGAVADGQRGVALGIDIARPAFFRIGYNADTRELFLACDLALTPERPAATVHFCRFAFDPRWQFRAALARYYELYPGAFARRVTRQGLWMPFARISQVEDWQDFGFAFKEGDNETPWDDAHQITTFRYTEPMTWWMKMPAEMPRTIAAALAEAQRRAAAGDRQAQALLTSGYHDQQGQFAARLLDTPWCDGAVWSMNSMPDISGEVTDFSNKWNPALRERLYGAGRAGDLDGEYIDSSEGYVTDELDFRRDHFAAAQTPLTFCPETHQPAIFRGLIAQEYARGIAQDVHGMGKLMMANSTPIRLCWLAPWLDVMGSETNWNPGGNWRPMSDADLLYRRAMCKGKPYCFLMNTEFERFSHQAVERYMKRALAYGMFPGFFSHNASQGHYFTRPELYNRDRPLFKKYVPVCRLLAEAGWEPVTGARCSDARVYLERFGTQYLTVFNDSQQVRTVTIQLDSLQADAGRELLSDQPVTFADGQAPLTLQPQDVAVIRLGENAQSSVGRKMNRRMSNKECPITK
jgi:hypothetical protein